jgi:hypothetical protein
MAETGRRSPRLLLIRSALGGRNGCHRRTRSGTTPPETRPRQQEVLIEIYRKGKIAEAFGAFKKIYLEFVDEVIDHLKPEEAGDSSARKLAKR